MINIGTRVYKSVSPTGDGSISHAESKQTETVGAINASAT
jgi:hypothetical protein